MLKLDNEIITEVEKYFDKKVYNTFEILKDDTYKLIHIETRDFLENLTFEEKGIVRLEILISEYKTNEEVIEKFFRFLERKFGANARDIFLETNNETKVDISKNCNEEKVKTIKKFILSKYSKMYKNFRKTYGKKVIEQTDIHICPYCNRSYIGVIESEEGSRSITPDLDHFYPKSRYPFLSVTFSNLIPSCLFCNERAKNDIDFYKTSIYPPSKIFNDIEFDYDIYLNKIFIKNYDKLISKKEYETHLDTFLIQETYASHTEVLRNIVTKYRKYRKSKMEDIAKHTVGLSKFDIEKVVFFEYEFMNKKKELLYKLKKDLYDKIVKTKSI